MCEVISEIRISYNANQSESLRSGKNTQKKEIHDYFSVQKCFGHASDNRFHRNMLYNISHLLAGIHYEYYFCKMRKLLFISALLACFFVYAASMNSESYSDDYTPMASLRRTLPDSIYSQLENRPLLFYSCGHYGYAWSIITQTDSSFRAFSGRVYYNGDNQLTEPTDSTRFDSVAMFSANEALLKWGFDTLPSAGLKMKSLPRVPYVTIYQNLWVMDSCGGRVFASDNAATFSGADSVEFNSRFRKLSLIMHWLSQPIIRPYIPDSVIY